MKIQKIVSLIFCFVIWTPQFVAAQARTSGTVTTTTTAETVEPVTTPTPSTINMNQMLNQTSAAQSNTAMIAAVAAGAFGAAAVSCCSGTPCGYCGAFIAAAAGSALVSAENSGKSAGNSDAACKFIAGGCSGTSSSSSTSSGDGSAASGSTASDSSAKTSAEVLAKTSQTLASVGAKVDYANKTVTTPDGKTSSFTPGISSSALAAAGLTASDLKSMAAKAIAEKGGPKAVDAVENDGAIGVGSKSGGTSETGRGFTATVVSQGPKLGINRDPAQVAGLTANLNGTPIGVASDSIFGIIDRRYEYHDKKGSFLPSK